MSAQVAQTDTSIDAATICVWEVRIKRMKFWRRRGRIIKAAIMRFLVACTGLVAIWFLSLISPELACYVGLFVFAFAFIPIIYKFIGNSLGFQVPGRGLKDVGYYTILLLFLLNLPRSPVAADFAGADGASFADWAYYLIDTAMSVLLFDIPAQLINFKLSGIAPNGHLSRFVITGFRLCILGELVLALWGAASFWRKKRKICNAFELYQFCCHLPNPADYSVKRVGAMFNIPEPAMGADEFLRNHDGG